MRLTPFLLAAACGDNGQPDGLLGGGRRLQVIAYELSDGTTVFDHTTFHDAERDEDCAVAKFSDLRRYCLPTSAAGIAVFTESTCMRVLGAERSDRPPPTYFVRYYTSGGELLPSRLYLPGHLTDAPAQRWELEDGYCKGPYDVDPTLAFYTVGAPVTPDALVEVSATRQVEGDRLTVDIDTSSDGWRSPGTITDRELGAECRFVASPNAASAPCMPQGLTPVSYYSDASCQQSLVAGERGLHRDLASGCAEVVDRGEPFVGSVVYEQLGESCVVVPTPSEALYNAGTTSPVAELAREDAGGARIHTIELGRLLGDALLRDTMLGVDCAIADGVCAPVSATSVLTYFRDPLCAETIEVAFVPTGACRPPVLVAGDRLVGDVYDGTLYELTTGDRCDSYAPPSRFAVHLVSASPIDDLVTVERTSSDTDLRLRRAQR